MSPKVPGFDLHSACRSMASEAGGQRRGLAGSGATAAPCSADRDSAVGRTIGRRTWGLRACDAYLVVAGQAGCRGHAETVGGNNVECSSRRTDRTAVVCTAGGTVQMMLLTVETKTTEKLVRYSG